MADFTQKDGVSLEKYFDKQIADLEKSTNMKIEALDKKLELMNCLSQAAIDKAEKTVNERLKTMNEFRSAMKDLQSTYITRDMFELHSKVSEGKLRTLELSKVSLDAKADASLVNRTQIISLISILLAIAGFIMGIVGG